MYITDPGVTRSCQRLCFISEDAAGKHSLEEGLKFPVTNAI